MLDLIAEETAAEAYTGEMDFETIFETLVDAAVVIDAQGQILRINSACTRLFGYSANQLVGRNVKCLMPEHHAAQHDGYIQAYRQTGVAKIIGIGRQVSALHRDGHQFPVRLSVGQHRGPDGLQFVGVISDKTDEMAAQFHLEELQSQLQHLARLGAVNEMGAVLAHELNQPLTALMFYLSAAEKHLQGSNPKAAGLFTNAVAEAQRASDILKRIRNTIEHRPQRIEPLDVGDVLQESLQLLSLLLQRHSISLEVPSPPAMMVEADRVGLGQVFANLIKNAIDALVEAQTPQACITLRFGETKDAYLIDIEDNGPGFAKLGKDKLFTPFQSSKEQGLGVGLCVSKTIAQSLGGSLSALDKADVRAEGFGANAGGDAPNKGQSGAIFTLSLPKSGITA